MANRNVLYRVMVYDDAGNCFCEYETSKESKALEYAHKKVMTRAGVNRFYIDERQINGDSNKRRFIEDEDY